MNKEKLKYNLALVGFYHKLIFLTFFHQVCYIISLLKFFKVILDKQQQKYVPAHSMWLNRVFADLANMDEPHCLTIDCSGVNKNGLGRYRTQADDPEKQVCYFNKPSHD